MNERYVVGAFWRRSPDKFCHVVSGLGRHKSTWDSDFGRTQAREWAYRLNISCTADTRDYVYRAIPING
jgi:hypothetical protein